MLKLRPRYRTLEFRWQSALSILREFGGSDMLIQVNMPDFELLRQAWAGIATAEQVGAPDWPQAGFAIEGDFSGIQRFVLRPVPGAGGAARRLRARSFRVLALTRLVAHSIEEAFTDIDARLFYSAGGRFLIVARVCSDWQARLARFQATLDNDLLRQYKGELAFHLAGAEFRDGRVPRAALADSLARRKLTPLEGALRTEARWSTDRFVFRSSSGGRCDGCAGTEETRMVGDEQLCHSCIADRDLGARLLRSHIHRLVETGNGPLILLGKRWSVSDNGNLSISSVTHAPLHNGQLATFEELSARAVGRPYLGYLRIDADRIGAAFGQLENDPLRIWGLSRLLDGSFSSTVDNLLSTRFTNVYPVYGGGDDLFVIGPWQDVLAFASSLRREFRTISGGQLTFSAGVALAKRKQHILTKSDESEHALNTYAKGERDSIHALGTTMRWDDFDKALCVGHKLAQFRAQGKIRGAILQNILELHARWQAGDARWHSLLYYQAQRNLKDAPEASRFVQQVFLQPGHVWPHADFAVRYAMLASGAEQKGD
jgi:CRISPR-associated protein Csm1